MARKEMTAANKSIPAPYEAAPTMIIPNGTKIEVDNHGQLSIRTPGNLVLQNSGHYGTLESVTGSIRIEPNVQIEAVNVECAEVCYVQGSLTAWKVKARAIELDESARAHIILQETERLQIGRQARLVGNFSSERELGLLCSRFARQLRGVPFQPERRGMPADALHAVPPATSVPRVGPGVASDEPPACDELPEPLLRALVLLERTQERPALGPSSERAVAELIRLLRARQLDTLASAQAGLFGRVIEPTDDLRRAQDLIRGFFIEPPPESPLDLP